MADVKTIREIAERNVKILTRKPSRGRLTGVTKARITDGVRCEIEEGPWKLAADMPVKAGGEDTAPTPGMPGRGAPPSVLPIGMPIWAARTGIAIKSPAVEVQGVFSAPGRVAFGGANPPGCKGVAPPRYSGSVPVIASQGRANFRPILTERPAHVSFRPAFPR